MLTILPLLTTLTTIPVAVSGFSTSEKRTLQSAITGALYSNAINHFYQQCKEQPAENGQETTLSLTDKQRGKLLNLLKQAVHTDDIELLLRTDQQLTRASQKALVIPKDCLDQTGLQSMLDNYEVALFSLEIALPLNRAIAQPKPMPSRNNEVQQLIERSTAIAQVSISDKQLLTAVQQANFFHFDYQSRFIFKVEQGWKKPMPAYVGMHKYIEDSQLTTTAKQWLIFLDKNNHFIKAIELDKAGAYLKLLQQPQWRFDSMGSLQRF
uniref:hypothetical protein n=1 Tax=Rheinheimera sp. TaxID=1869214 RepID=UPI00404710B4